MARQRAGWEGQHSPPLPGGTAEGWAFLAPGRGAQGDVSPWKEGGTQGYTGQTVDMKAKHADVCTHTRTLRKMGPATGKNRHTETRAANVTHAHSGADAHASHAHTGHVPREPENTAEGYKWLGAQP